MEIDRGPEPETDAICAVCGQPPRGDVVHCTICEGVYHRECWIFFGTCSRYGCGGIGFTDGFPEQTSPVLVVIDGTTPEPVAEPRIVPARGEEAHVQLGLVSRETDYGQVLTLFNQHRIAFRSHVPAARSADRFAAWVYVPYLDYGRARRLVEAHQIPAVFTPLHRRADLVNYPFALAAVVAAAVALPGHVPALSVLALIAVAGRDAWERAVFAARRVLVRRRPVLPPGKGG